MEYIKDKTEQDDIFSKIEKLYEYNYIDLEDIELYKNFKYCTILHSSYTISYDFFFNAIEELSLEDEMMYFLSTDKELITSFFKLHHFYPTVKKDIKKDIENISDFLYEDVNNDMSIFTYCVNISIFSTSFKWLISINLSNELACFSSNDKELVKAFKEKMQKFAQKDIFIHKDRLIKEYNIGKDEKDFDSLPVGKLEII